MNIFNEELKDISEKIEKYVRENDGSYIDATLAVCELNRLDPTIVAKQLSKPIKEKLEIEGLKLNILSKKSAVLPI